MEPLIHTLLLAILFLLLTSFSPIAAQEDDVDIYSLTMDSKIISRFAHTTITSHVVNKAEHAQEITFQVEIPQTAFISNFSMTIDGETYPVEMKEKTDTLDLRDQSIGVIKATEKNLEQFQVSVIVPPTSSATFELIYEELLKRRLGKYELRLKVHPQQLVRHLQIDIHIFEPQGINSLGTEISFMTKDLEDALTTIQNKTKAHIVFKAQQQEEPRKLNTILDGNFIVHYDVDQTTAAGDIQIENGYFVHHFAPRELPLLPKNVVFVIDRSGSMTGRKIKKTREALVKILDDLKEEDHFNLVAFSGQVIQWKPMLLQASKEHRESAKKFLSNTQALGVTNLNKAILVAVRMLNEIIKRKQLPAGSVSMVILLTDGNPTEGETQLQKIQENVKLLINGQYHLYCLSFGFNTNYAFLEKLALDNGGMVRRIYDNSEYNLQLQDFYQEVANPLLTNVEFHYPDNTVELLTQYNFKVFFKDSELVVAGKLMPQAPDLLSVQVRGQSNSQNLSFQTEVKVVKEEEVFKDPKNIFNSFMERLWAYLTIQQLLEKAISASESEKQSLKARALNLSLNFNFVTPLTCMVVNLPKDQGQPQLAMKSMEVDHENVEMERPMRQRKRKPKRKKIISQESTELIIPKPTVGIPISPTPSLKPVERAPHFILSLLTSGNSKEVLCVDIKGSPMNPLNLITDPIKGIEVTGNYKEDMDTFSWFQVSYRTLEIYLYVTVDSITVIHGRGQHRKSDTYHWDKTFSLGYPRLIITVEHHKLLVTGLEHVTIGLVPLRNVNLGLHLFLQNPVHFSQRVRGIIGQFYLPSFCTSLNDGKMKMTVLGRTYTVTRKPMFDYQNEERRTPMPLMQCLSLEQTLSYERSS